MSTDLALTPHHAILDAARAYGAAQDLPYAGALPPTDAWRLVQSGIATIVDVRSRFEHEFVGRVPNSELIEWRTYENGDNGRITSRPNPDFIEELSRRHKPDEVLLLLCRSAVRSHNAAIAATEAGFTQVYNILEGFEGDKDATEQRGATAGWRKASLPWIQG